MQSFFDNPRNLIIIAAIVGTLLLGGIFATVIAIVSPSGHPTDSEQTEQDEKGSGGGKSQSNLQGSTSKLTGSTTSTRNLKGLTLRINQIETCNPTVVSAYIAVSSDAGVVNKNFKKADVSVYVDGKQMKTFDFNEVDGEKTPLTNMLVIDHSGSMKGAPIENAKSAATQYVQKLRTGDQVGLVQFDDRVDLLEAITNDKARVVAAIGTIQPRGDTAVYDALNSAVAQVPNCGRKAVTILTDGDDTASKSNSQSVITAANTANLPVFSVGIKGEGFNPATIKQISEATGGQYLEANTPTEIANLYTNIDGQLTGQFVANLKLSIPKDGSSHTLKIVSNVEGSPTSSERSFIY